MLPLKSQQPRRRPARSLEDHSAWSVTGDYHCTAVVTFVTFPSCNVLLRFTQMLPPAYRQAWHVASAGSLRRSSELDFHSAPCASPMDGSRGVCKCTGNYPF